MATVVRPDDPGHQPSPSSVVLRNQELLTNIFRHYLPWDPRSLQKAELLEGRIQLRDLAITCKAFKDPALNCLWTFMDSLLPLVKVLPNLRIYDNAYYFHGSLPNNSPFRQYAPKIRILDFRPSSARSTAPQSPTTISPQLLIYLMRELEGHLILPGLKKIEIRHFPSSGGMDAFSILPLLCSSSVQSISLLGNAFSDPFFRECCLPAMSQKLGSLKYLLIKVTTRHAAPNICDPILRLTALENLQLEISKAEGIVPNTILRLARTLANLTNLVLDVHFPNHQVADESFRLAETDLGLSLKLRAVLVISRLPDRICPCIPQFILARTTKFNWKIPKRTTITDTASFESILEALSKIPTLQFVKIQSNDASSINLAAVLPFLSRLSLQGLAIEIPILSEEPPLSALVEEAFVKRTSESRPATLKRLNLAHAVQADEGVRTNDGITLECLSQVSRHGIGLEHLSAVLRPSFADNTPNEISLEEWVAILQKGPRSVSTLQTMVICDARDASVGREFKEANNVAQILDLLFPHLVSIKPYQDDPAQPYWSQRWAFIENMRRAAQATRVASTS